jgi:hypothetical protein
MAFALLLAVSLGLTARSQIVRGNRKLGLLLIVMSLLLYVYAVMVRYNAALAVVPLVFIGLTGIMRSWKIRLSVAVLLAIFALVSNVVVNKLFNVQSAHPEVAIMLDDINNSLPSEEVAHSDVDPNLKNEIVDIKNDCHIKNVQTNSFWICTNSQQRLDLQRNSSSIKILWKKTLLGHPSSYVHQRIDMFTRFLFMSNESEYIWHPGVEPNNISVAVRFPTVSKITKNVYIDFFATNFGLLFRPWFWLAISLWILRYSLKRNTEHQSLIVALNVSAILYIVCYGPITVAHDYRYIYWSVLACSIAGALTLTDRRVLSDKQKSWCRK